jgi:anti-sigma factor RsiW
MNHLRDSTVERYVMGRIVPADLRSVESHLLACDACRTRTESLESSIVGIRGALADHVTGRERVMSAGGSS